MVTETRLVVVGSAELALRGGLEWADDFLRDWLGTKAKTTLSNYKADLEDFARFLRLGTAGEAVAYLLHVGRGGARRAVVAYRAEMAGRPVWRSRTAQAAGDEPIRHGLAPRTINRRVAALSSVVKLAKEVDRIDWDLGQIPTYQVNAIKDVSGVGREDYLRLRVALEDEAKAARKDDDVSGEARSRRDLAIMRLMYDNGLRRKEVAQLDYPRDVDLERRLLSVLGKGRHEAENVALARPTADAIADWLRLRGPEPGPLFTSFSNRATGAHARPSITSFNKIIARVRALAGLTSPVNPHRFRHSMITRALDLTGGDVRKVQKLSRHKNERMVLHYDDRRRELERELVELVAGDEEGE